jgi:hypothetical protein
MEDSELQPFRAALREARASFDNGSAERGKLTSRVFRLDSDLALLRRTITALAAMCSESPWLDPLGITESCAEIMEIEEDELTTQGVMKKLEYIGFDLSSQKNPAASVHSVLSRLAGKGKITKSEEGAEVTWRGPKYQSRSAPDDFARSAEISDDDIPF